MGERMLQRPRVLIVDDDALSRSIVAAKIASRAEVVEASDGREALVQLQSAVDLVVLDLEMPNVDGYDLLGCIRGLPRLQHLPVVVLTAKEDRYSLEKALMYGATSFLLKPLNWTAFGTHITHLLEIAHMMRTVHGGARMPLAAAG